MKITQSLVLSFSKRKWMQEFIKQFEDYKQGKESTINFLTLALAREKEKNTSLEEMLTEVQMEMHHLHYVYKDKLSQLGELLHVDKSKFDPEIWKQGKVVYRHDSHTIRAEWLSETKK